MQDNMWRDADPEPYDHERWNAELRATFGSPSRYGVGERNIKILMGVDPEKKWPVEGVVARIINGWKVFVDPLVGSARDGKYGHRRAVHRMRAVCVECEQEMSAGRVHQHVCYGANGPKRRRIAPRIRCRDCGAVGQLAGHVGCNQEH